MGAVGWADQARTALSGGLGPQVQGAGSTPTGVGAPTLPSRPSAAPHPPCTEAHSPRLQQGSVTILGCNLSSCPLKFH